MEVVDVDPQKADLAMDIKESATGLSGVRWMV